MFVIEVPYTTPSDATHVGHRVLLGYVGIISSDVVLVPSSLSDRRFAPILKSRIEIFVFNQFGMVFAEPRPSGPQNQIPRQILL